MLVIPIIYLIFYLLVGLAETSPFNPLKVLHSLLEPSYPATGPTVSVIGISNWRLDNSKSSRALLVQRYDLISDSYIIFYVLFSTSYIIFSTGHNSI